MEKKGIEFEKEYMRFWEEFGEGKKMVLSTSLDNIVTSRMMSVVAINGRLYFQTDCTFRKYRQLRANGNVALCIDNIQIEGKSIEIGHPKDNIDFCNSYKANYPSSFARYTSLENERLFVVAPIFIEKWTYIDGIPYIEKFDIQNENYILQRYCGV